MKNWILSIGALLLSASSMAQNDLDALRLSQDEINGTARFLALGGTMSALGGDLSSIGINPAGLATFRNDQFTIGLSLNSQASTSFLNGQGVDDNRYSFNMPNLGIAKVINRKGDWNRFALGFAYNQTANFSNSYFSEGYNENSSRTQAYIEEANGTHYEDLNPFSAGMAFGVALIDTFPGSTNQYYSNNPSAGQDQRYSLESRGRKGEVTIGFAGTYKEQLKLGVSMGFPSYTYEETNRYSEFNVEDTASNAMTQFEQIGYLNSSADGFNLRFGVQFQPVYALRFGFAFQTPTWYTVTETFQSQMTASFDNGASFGYDTGPGFTDYRFTSPAKVQAGMAVVLGKMGFINIDYHWQDYRQVRFKGGQPGNFLSLNSFLDNSFAARSELRIGGEFNAGPFVLRGGGGLQSSPYAYAEDFQRDANFAREFVSFGFGYKMEQVALDFGYLRYRKGKRDISLYETNQDQVNFLIDEVKSRFNATLVYTF